MTSVRNLHNSQKSVWMFKERGYTTDTLICCFTQRIEIVKKEEREGKREKEREREERKIKEREREIERESRKRERKRQKERITKK